MSALPGAVVRTFISSSDLSAKKYFFVQQDADGKATIATGTVSAGTDVLGVVLDGGAASGDPVSIVVSGPAKVSVGTAVDEGDRLIPDSAGEAIKTTTAGDEIIAIAHEDGADGDIIEVLVGRFGPYAIT